MSCAASARLAVSFTPLTPEDSSVYGIMDKGRKGGMVDKEDDMIGLEKGKEC